MPETDTLVARCAQLLNTIRTEVNQTLVGQERLVDNLLIALLTGNHVQGGHILLEGVPGLAKTTAVRALAAALGLETKRISFTPDLLPADVIGSLIYNQKEGTFTPHKGPIFANLLIADEINRAPAKVQSALLEAMQERQVTLGDETYPLPSPFLVMATQNPIEQEGTYPLPEAQTDRFMLKCVVKHPSREDERRIMKRFAQGKPAAPKCCISPEDIPLLLSAVDNVYCDEKVGDYILDLVFATRDPAAFKGLASLKEAIELGASPRATLCLNLAARANALLRGRAYATPQDVKEVAHEVLRHRLLLTYEAEAENLTPDAVIDRLLAEVPVP
ncbi:MAG: MoxR family ATPase [Lentisphaeraceae bacterium]|nr:MoxR family ATPase [Lentisphaeraceae bacterium]